MTETELKIEKTWDDREIDHEPVKIFLKPSENEQAYFTIRIEAPFFNSPQRPDKKIGEFFNLWDFEVVEVFFLSESGNYLELEFGPYGHYVVLLLQSPNKQIVKQGLAIEYEAKISGNRWTGIAKIPVAYLPQKATKINAYAIHGESDNRKFEALFPVPSQRYDTADFHRLEYFKQMDYKSFLQNSNDNQESSFWEK